MCKLNEFLEKVILPSEGIIAYKVFLVSGTRPYGQSELRSLATTTFWEEYGQPKEAVCRCLRNEDLPFGRRESHKWDPVFCWLPDTRAGMYAFSSNEIAEEERERTQRSYIGVRLVVRKVKLGGNAMKYDNGWRAQTCELLPEKE